MAAGIGFACGISVYVYPRVDTKSLALFEQEFFTFSELYWAHKVSRIIPVLSHKIPLVQESML
jgi:hypothetical protein